MPRPPLPTLPSIIGDLVADRTAARALLAAMAALFAAGLDPKVMAPMAPTTQAAIRAQPGIEGLILLVSLATALLLLFGGAVGDMSRARPIIVGGLAVSLVSAIVAWLLYGTGVPFTLVRFAGVASAAMVMPVSLAMAATSYTGVARATAIGIAYAAYGAGQGISPTLVALIPGQPWPAFLAATAGCVLALWIVRGRITDLRHADRVERPIVIGTALWGGGVVMIATAILWFGAGLTNPLRLALLAGGVALIGVYLARERRRHATDRGAVHVERRPVTIALFVGLIIAVAQVVPMSQLPLYFGVAMQYGPVFGMIALAPLFLGLVAAGPVAGFLLARFQPRHLVLAGMVAAGLGNVLLALVMGRETPYPTFVGPLILVGGGFVIATTVRTAIIFSAVPRGLPATAAALNEASIEVGTRAGIVVITALLAQVAVRAYASTLAGTPAEVEAATAPFRDLLIALGTPSFAQMLEVVQPGDLAGYRDAYETGVRAALLGAGLIALLGAAIAWVALGRRNPLQTVYDHRDEREAVVAG